MCTGIRQKDKQRRTEAYNQISILVSVTQLKLTAKCIIDMRKLVLKNLATLL